VYKDLRGRIPLIIDGGPTDFGVESTVIDIYSEYFLSLSLALALCIPHYPVFSPMTSRQSYLLISSMLISF
jgi:hypothetical protein